jgi:predicted enzyme related to lactoylglutathione lyase
MTSTIRGITIDCRDPYRLAQFWAAVLGYTDDPNDPNSPGDPEALLIDPRGLHPALVFVPVPEPKTAKNRVHLDLRPSSVRDVEVERVLGLGGTLVADHRRPDGSGWAVLADPEGNEFCIERSAAERGIVTVDTGERPFPPVRASGERELLVGLLDWYRDGVVAKATGMAQHLAVATPLGSASSVAGRVKHLALVEDSWFSIRFAGRPEMGDWAGADFDADPDWEFHTALDEPLEVQIERYERACATSRAVTEAHDFDDLSVVPAGSPPERFTLRWTVVHLLEETARHLGHLDVLRELLDGTTGE